MSNTENTNANDEVAALRAEVDRLSALVGSGNTPGGTPADVNTSNVPTVRAPGEGATIIGAAADPRGGTVLGYSDGTVKLVNVPQSAQNTPADPWGNAPEGEYVHFFMDDNGNRYNFVASDGNSVVSVDNPVQAKP